MATIFDNVKFDVYQSNYNEDHSIEVLDEDPTLTRQVGHIENSTRGMEGDVPNNSDRLRWPSHSLIVKVDAQTEDVYREGIFIRLTHQKAPETKIWKPVTRSRQFLVQAIDDVYSAGRYRKLFMVSKDDT